MLRRPLEATTFVLLLAAGTLFGQVPAAAPAFEVASIKPSAPLDPAKMISGKMHIGVNIDGARVDIGNLTLMDLVAFAYTVKPYQISGLDWMGAQRFDVLAKLPEGTSKDQVSAMVQTLLAERFKLKLHRESKDQAIYALVVGKNGPKLKESPPEVDAPKPDGAAPSGPGQINISRDGKGMSVGGGPMGPVRMSMGSDGTMHLEVTKATMANFADVLARFMDRPVMDMTELKGTYQVALDLSMDDMRNVAKAAGVMMGPGGGPPPGGEPGRGPAIAPGTDSAPSSIFLNVQQLGLKLESRKSPVTALVIDHAEKMPTEN